MAPALLITALLGASTPPLTFCVEEGLPVLNISEEEAARGKCIECLACEVECLFHGKGGGVMDLPIDLEGWLVQEDRFAEVLRYVEPCLPLHRRG